MDVIEELFQEESKFFMKIQKKKIFLWGGSGGEGRVGGGGGSVLM